MKNINSFLTFQLHPALQTLVEPARRTLLPRGHGDGTLGPPQAHVVLPVLHGALEEALARLAAEYPVVEAGDLVAADRARAVYQLLAGDAGLGGQRRVQQARFVLGLVKGVVLGGVLQGGVFLEAAVQDVVVQRAAVDAVHVAALGWRETVEGGKVSVLVWFKKEFLQNYLNYTENGRKELAVEQ